MRVSRRRAARRAAETKKLYLFEELWVPAGPDLPIARLRTLARRIWLDAGRSEATLPSITAGEGVRQGSRLLSYCWGPRSAQAIVLARSQRNPRTLIHEMTHALGPSTHGRAFKRLYEDLLGRYL